MECANIEFVLSAENGRTATAYATELAKAVRRAFPESTVTQTRAAGDESLDAGTIVGIALLIKEAIKFAKALEGWADKAAGAKVTLKKNGTKVLEFVDAQDAIEFIKNMEGPDGPKSKK